MLSEEHPHTNTFNDFVLKKKAFLTPLSLYTLRAGAKQNIFYDKVCTLTAPHLSINESEFKMCDHYVVSIMSFLRGNTDHEIKSDHPFWDESYLICSSDIFLIPFATASILCILVSTLKS